MDARAVLEKAIDRGIYLYVEDGNLKYRAEEGALTDSLKSEITSCKPMIIEILNAAKAAEQTISQPMEIVPLNSRIAPLSFAQERLWFLDKLGRHYTIPARFELLGELDFEVFENTLRSIIERHQILRSRYIETSGQPRQVVDDDFSLPLTFEDLSILDEKQKGEEVIRLTNEEIGTKFDLQHDLMIRVKLVKLEKNLHLVFFTIHHIAGDEWSMNILKDEFMATFNAFAGEMVSTLPELPIQYADYAAWQRQLFTKEYLESRIDFWKRSLKDAEFLDLPTDRPRCFAARRSSARFQYEMRPRHAEFVKGLASRFKTTPYIVFLTLLQYVLRRWSGQRDVVVAAPESGRTNRQTHTIIGFFVNILLMRQKFFDDDTFVSVIDRNKEFSKSAYANCDLSYDQLVAALQGGRSETAAMYGSKVAFQMQEDRKNGAEGSVGGGIELANFVSLVESDRHTATDIKTEILVTAIMLPEGLRIIVDYSADLFDESSLLGLCMRLGVLIDKIGANQKCVLDQIDLSLPTLLKPDQHPLPLLRIQKSIQSDIQRHSDGKCRYLTGGGLRISGQLDVSAFDKAVHAAAEMVPALITRSVDSTNIIVAQYLTQSKGRGVPVIDLSEEKCVADTMEGRYEGFKRECVEGGISICCPFKNLLIKVSDSEYHWLGMWHSLIMDEAGFLLFVKTVSSAYSDIVQGVARMPRSYIASYIEYISRDREYRFTSEIFKARKYWFNSLSNTNVTSFSGKHTGGSPDGVIHASCDLAEDIGGRLRLKAEALSIDYANILIASCVLYVSRITCEERITLGIPLNMRLGGKHDALLINCTNTVPVTFEINKVLNLEDACTRVNEAIQEATRHSGLTYEEIQRLAARGGSKSESCEPLYRLSVNVIPLLDQGLDFSRCRASTTLFKLFESDLSLRIMYSEQDGSAKISCFANPAHYQQWEVQDHLDRFAIFLGRLSKADDRRQLHDLDVVIERDLPSARPAGKEAILPGREQRTVDELLQWQFEEQPDSRAVIAGDEQITYRELRQRSDELAVQLRALGVTANTLVAVCLNRSIELVVSVLATWRSGAAYVPLDPDYPQGRLDHMIEECNPFVVLTVNEYASKFACAGKVLLLDKQSRKVAGDTKLFSIEPSLSSKGDLAYAIFTSGSTGYPKAVGVERGGFENLVLWYENELRISKLDRVLVVSSFSFDLTQKNYFSTLIAGAQLHLAPDSFDPETIVRIIHERKITIVNLAPSAFYALIDAANNLGYSLNLLRVVVLGGEPIDTGRMTAFHLQNPNVDVLNSYGPTECTDVVTSYTIDWNDQLSPIPLGSPLPGVQIFVVNKNGELCPRGVYGEIHIGGSSVGRGYLNRPALTCSKFLMNPEFNRRAGIIYRTGDIGRYLENGRLEYSGRIDDQLKIRGHRIEPEEIERLLSRHPHVHSAIVSSRKLDQTDSQLLAYFKLEPDINHETHEQLHDSLKNHLAQFLPDYMIPSFFIPVEDWPLNPNGKIDKKALPAPDEEELGVEPYQAPRSALERELISIWSEYLKIDQDKIGVSSNFFSLGGHSLLLTKLIHQLKKRLNVVISLREFLENPTVLELTRLIDTDRSSQSCEVVPIAQKPAFVPLSYAQHRIWHVERLKGTTNEHNMAFAIRLKGGVNKEVLEKSFEYLVNRHQLLRTYIETVSGEPMQVLDELARFLLRYVDLLETRAADRDDVLLDEINRNDALPFDLSRAPLLRAVLIKVRDQDYMLRVNMHHIISDGWSQTIFYKELASVYGSLSRGQVPNLDEPKLTYADYALWQKDWVDSSHGAQQEQFWSEYLSGCSQRLWLPGQERTDVEGNGAAAVGILVPANISAKLLEIGRLYNGTLFNILNAAFSVLLRRVSGQRDFNIGLPVMGRHIQGTENLLGMFLNTLPVRYRLNLALPFGRILEEQVKNLGLVLKNQDLPFERIIKACNYSRKTGNSPLFQVLFNMLNLPRPEGEGHSDLNLDMELCETSIVDNKFDLTVYLSESANGVDIQFNYSKMKFSSKAMSLLLEQYKNLLIQISENHEKACSDYTLDTVREADKPAIDRGSTGFSGTVIERFLYQAALTPERTAISFGELECSYGELLADVDAIASIIHENAPGKGHTVGIWGKRDHRLVAAILASLKVGAVYSILDRNEPEERLLRKIDVLRPSLVLQTSDMELPERIKSSIGSSRLAAFNELAGSSADFSHKDRISVHVDPADPACITFTSGSTGFPLAVVGTHRGLSSYLSWLPEDFGLGERDRFSMLSGLTHDPLQRDIFTALCIGATLVIPDIDIAAPGGVPAWLKRSGVTVAHLTPSLAEAFFFDNDLVLPEFRLAFLTGENPAPSVLEHLLKANKNLEIYNCYGTTETQRALTYCKVTPYSGKQSVCPIASHSPDTRLEVVNNKGSACAIGELGELEVVSRNIACGYLNGQALTASRFKRDGELCRYRTGDQGVYLGGRVVRYVGREDEQINVRGFRVDLMEIESHLKRISSVKDAAMVTVNSTADDIGRLVACVVMRDGYLPGDNKPEVEGEIRAELSKSIPDYMVPSKFLYLEKIPRTFSGKKDKRALFEFVREASIEYQPPKTRYEKGLVSIWSSLLSIPPDEISANANFFELGGHSLVLLKLIAEIKAAYSIMLSLQDLIENQVLGCMASEIESRVIGRSITVSADMTEPSSARVEIEI